MRFQILGSVTRQISTRLHGNFWQGSRSDRVWYLVHSEPAIKGHVLTALLDKIPDDVRCYLSRAYKETKAASSGDLRHNLSLFEGAFMTTRYPFEAEADLSGIDLKGLMSLSSFLRGFVAALEPRETMQWD